MLSLVVGPDESKEGVEPECAADVEKIGFIRGRLRFGASSSNS